MAEKIWSNIEHDVQDQQSLTSLLNDGRIPADSDAAFLKSEVDRVREKSGSAEDAVRNIKNEARMRESLESRENGGRVRKGGEASKMQSLVDRNRARAKEDNLEGLPAAAVTVEETVSTTVNGETVTETTTSTTIMDSTVI